MTTIDRLVVEAAVDPTGITRGLDRGAAAVADFVDEAARTFRTAPPMELPVPSTAAMGAEGARLADALLDEATTRLARGAGSARDAVLDGIADPTAFAARGGDAAEAFQEGATRRLRDSRGRFLPAGFTEGVVDEMGAAGVAAGEQLGDGIATGVRRKQRDILNAVNDAGEVLERFGTGATIGITAPLVAAAGASLRFASTFEDALAGVQKTTNLSTAEVAALGVEIRKLSELPGRPGADQIAGIVESAAQLGIARDNLLSFAETIAAINLASDLSTEEAASQLARFANITQLAQEDIGRLGSAIIALGNTTAATESEIAAIALRLAGAGTQAGLTQAEIVGFAAALASVGVEAEAGGSALSRVMGDIANAVKSGGQELTLFARVAGVSAKDFRRAFETDAADAVLDVIEGLDRVAKSGGNVFAVLEQLDFTDLRVRDALLRAAGAGELFRESIETSSAAFRANTALNAEAATFYGTLSSELKGVLNTARNVAAEFGAALAPAFRDVLTVARSLLGPLRIAVRAFAELPEPVRLTVIAFGGMLALVGPLALGLGKFAQALFFARNAMVTLSGASTALAGAGGLAAIGTTLAVGGAVLVGLGALVAYFHATGKAAREAKADAEAFTARLASMSQIDISLTRTGLFAELDLAVAKAVQLQTQIREGRSEFETVTSNAGAGAFNKTQAELDRVMATIGTLNDRLTETYTQFQQNDARIRQMTAEAEALAAAIAKAMQSGGTIDLDLGGADGAKALLSRANAVQDTLQSLDRLGRSGNGLLSETITLHTHVSNALADQRDLTSETARNLLQAKVTLREILSDLAGPVRLPAATRLETPRFTRPIQPIAQETITRAFAGTSLDPKLVKEAQQAVGGLRLELRATAIAGRGLLQIADAMGSIGDAARRSIDGVLSLIDSISTLQDAQDKAAKAKKEGDKSFDAAANTLTQITSIIGAIGGAMSVISGLGQALFGKTDAQREAEAITKRNNELLSDLTAELRGFTNSLGTITTTIDRLSTVPDLVGLARGGRAVQQISGVDAGIAALNEQLLTFGVTFEDLNRVAEANGIQLLDEKGRIVAAAFDQLVPILEATRAQLLRFGDSFDGITSRLTFRDEIFDLEGPVAEFERGMAILSTMAPELAAQIAGFDVNTEAGRAAIEEMFRSWASLSDEQRLALLEATDFESGEQFNDTILGMDSAMDQLRETTEAAVAALTNVPAGYKSAQQALDRFAAILPREADGLSFRPPEFTTPRPVGANFALRGGSAAGSATIIEEHFHYHDGAVRVDARDFTPRELFEVLREEARRESLARFGNAARAAEVL